MKKLWIKKLGIDNFRGLQNIELNFNETENRISGRNGTGKTAIRWVKFYYLIKRWVCNS